MGIYTFWNRFGTENSNGERARRRESENLSSTQAEDFGKGLYPMYSEKWKFSEISKKKHTILKFSIFEILEIFIFSDFSTFFYRPIFLEKVGKNRISKSK